MFVIAGATGKTGSVTAETLLSRGKKVRVLVRDVAKGERWRAKGAEVAVASLDDAASLSAALTGAAGAYLLVPPDLTSTDYLAASRKRVDAIVRATEAAHVPHVVFLSSIGAQLDEGTGPIRAVAYGERRLAESSAGSTFVRAAAFLENWASVAGAIPHGKLPAFLPPDLAFLRSLRATSASSRRKPSSRDRRPDRGPR